MADERIDADGYKQGKTTWTGGPASKRREPWRPRKYKTPMELWKDCTAYIEWVEQNPLFEAKVFTYQGESVRESLPKMRAMSLKGLWIFTGMSSDCWKDYSARPEFSSLCTRVEEIIYAQKFEGAAADLLNHAIIARDLGLRDHQDVSVNGAIGQYNADEVAEKNRRALMDMLGK